VFIYQAFGDRAIAAILGGTCGDHACATPGADALIALAKSNTNSLIASSSRRPDGRLLAQRPVSMASQLYWEKEIRDLQLYMMAR